MKKTKEPESILEVRGWKEAVAKETRKLDLAERLAYFNRLTKVQLRKSA